MAIREREIRPRAACHPWSAVFCAGWCRSCYLEKLHSGELPPKALRPSTCHPERAEYSGGLCGRCYNKAHRRQTPEIIRERNLRAWYGEDTPAWYEATVATQAGACAICRRKPTGRLQVDHDHTTGVRRALLCRNCNTLLGHAADNEWVLAAAILYLRDHAT